MFFKTREKVMKFFDNYATILSKAKQEAKHGKGFKILTHKQMLQRFPIAFSQVKAGNTHKNVLNKICHVTYSLYQAKEITQKVCSIIMNSIKLENRTDTIFMNYKNSKTYDTHKLLFILNIK